jgi:hypothetical protein
VPMKSVHRMIHQADRPDGAVEWACPQCGRYTVSHLYGPEVVLTGEPDCVRMPGAGFPPAPDGLQIPTPFDWGWLRRHGMAW